MNGGCPVIKIKNIVDGGVVIDRDNNCVDYEDFQGLEKYKVLQGDLLIAMTGATLGKMGIVPKELGGSFLNQRVGKFRLKDPRHKEFIYGLCNNDFFMKELMKYIGEGAQGNISANEICSSLVPSLNDEDILIYGEKFKVTFQTKQIIENNLKFLKNLMFGLLKNFF